MIFVIGLCFLVLSVLLVWDSWLPDTAVLTWFLLGVVLILKSNFDGREIDWDGSTTGLVGFGFYGDGWITVVVITGGGCWSSSSSKFAALARIRRASFALFSNSLICRFRDVWHCSNYFSSSFYLFQYKVSLFAFIFLSNDPSLSLPAASLCSLRNVYNFLSPS